MVTPLTDNQAARAAACKLLDAMANAKRFEVLTLLSADEISVGNLADKVGLTQSALSQHLAKLRAADLVSTRRDSQTIFYSCTSPAVQAVLKVLAEIRIPAKATKAA